MLKWLCSMMLCACCYFATALEKLPALDAEGGYQEGLLQLYWQQLAKYPDFPDTLIWEWCFSDIFWVEYARSQTRKLRDNKALKEEVLA